MVVTKKNKASAKKKPDVKPPSDAELKALLGSASSVWSAVVLAVKDSFAPSQLEWLPSKQPFGRAGRIRHKGRTLLYLLPGDGKFDVAVVLGERAVELAMAAPLPAAMKKRIAGAKRYVEGRSIRFPVNSASEVAVVVKLVELKTTPK
ncbi:MAG TPA: DUF3788 family protein [Rhizomicrobium sp.]